MARATPGAYLLAALVSACGPAAAVAPAPPPPAPAPTSASAGPRQAPPAPLHTARILAPDIDLAVTLSPEPRNRPVVRVTLAARPDDTPLTVWQAASTLDLAGAPEATDETGPVGVIVDTANGGTRMTLEKAPSGTTWLSYAVAAQLPAYPDPPAVAADPDRFEAAGEALLVVPAAFESRSVRAAVRIETDEIGSRQLVGAASSFGHGSRVETTVRAADLREGFYLAGGLLGQATFRAPEGNDDAAWLGYTAFDPRPAFADMAGLRTALTQLFRAPDADKVTFLFVADARPEGAFVVSRRPRSVLARIGVNERWSAPLRIAVAAAVIHGWIGSRLWVGPDDAAREAEAFWFTEGVTRNLARELLFRYGLLSPAEAAAEVEGLASLVATSPLARLSNEDLAKRPKAAVPLLVARGALYALRVDALVRAATKGKRSLDHVLSELYAAAAQKGAALSATAWVDVVAKDLGEGERAAFRDAIELGKPFDVPDGALGPCFRRVTRTYVGFDIGFDEDATSRGTPRKIVGLARGGPAERAGLREGDEVISLSAGRRSASDPVRVTVARGDDRKTFTYKPEGKRMKGIGFDRKRDVSDDACVP